MKNDKHLFLGIVITLFAYINFAVGSALVHLFASGFSIVEIVFFQNVIAFICVIPYFLYSKTLIFKRSNLFVHLVRDIASVLGFVCYFWAIKKIGLIDATTLAYSAPFFTPFIWVLWTKDKLEKDVWFSILLGFIGIGLILKPDKGIIEIKALIGLLAAILNALSLIGVRILNQKEESLSRTLFYLYVVSSIALLPFTIMWWITPTFYQWILLIVIGLTSGLGQILLTIAYRHGTASFLSPLSYSMVIYTLLISWMIFSHPPSYLSGLGAFLIILGGSITYVLRKKPKTLAQTFERPKHRWWHRNKPN